MEPFSLRPIAKCRFPLVKVQPPNRSERVFFNFIFTLGHFKHDTLISSENKLWFFCLLQLDCVN